MMLTEEIPFVVVDTETTGVKAETSRVIELAAVKVRGGAVIDRFAQLINPERSVPHRITRLTGISTAMLFDQPTAAEVLPRFLDFLGTSIFVAHNRTFDQRFINAELARLHRSPFANKTLCTLRLARRLLPGLRSKGLGHVADFFGIRIHARHRALGDAEATAQILLRFLSQLAQEHEIETLEELLAFQYRTYRTSRSKRPPSHLERLRTDVLDRLPARPGVYFMKDRKGATIYIGKAKDLNARVRSYFTAVEAHPPHTRKLVQAVRGVDWEETGSELSALLRESRLIKEHKPRFNRAQRRYRNRPFLRLDTAHAYPRLSWTAYLRDDGAEYFGPLSSRRNAERIVDLVNRFYRLRECDDDTFRQGRRCLYAEMDRCEAPCAGGDGAARYAGEVARVRRFLLGHDDTILAQLEQAMRAAAAQLDFEQARIYRDGLQAIERVLRRQRCVAAPVLDHHAVLVQPGLDEGTVQLFFVRFGRLAETVVLPLPPAPGDLARLCEQLARHFHPAQPRPERYFKEEVEEVRLLLHWMYANRERAVQVGWRPDEPTDAFAARIVEQAAGVNQKAAA